MEGQNKTKGGADIYIYIYVNVRIGGFTYDSCGEIITLAGRMRFQRYGFGFGLCRFFLQIDR